jgi:hypothetical protein
MNVANLVDPFGIHVQAGERGLAGCQPAQSPGLEFGRGAGVVAAFDTACVNVDALGQASAELFQQYPDYAIINSVPGLADSTGARLLAEIDADRSRFADARALKAYAGCAPITRASGRSISITHRHIKNNRLANVGWMWAFTAAANYAPARPIPGDICFTFRYEGLTSVRQNWRTAATVYCSSSASCRSIAAASK